MRFRTLSLALGLIGALAALVPGAALAAPELGVTITRSPETVPRNHERVTYSVVVRNEASATPSAGAELGCERSPWLREDTIAYDFTYQWLRDGVRLESPEDIAHGSQTDTYTVQVADAGKALQCMVAGANPNTKNSIDESTGHRTAYTGVSLPPVTVAPAPAIGAPEPMPFAFLGSGTRPSIFGEATEAGKELTCTAPPANWTNIATASTTAGSKLLTNVTTAKGAVNVTPNSSKVTLEKNSFAHGQFREGQEVAISGVTIAAGTKIEAIGGNVLTLSNPVTASGGQNTIEKPISAGSQPLEAGDPISGAGIPPGATIAKVEGRTVEISAPAETTVSGLQLKDAAQGIGVWSFEWLLNGVPRAGGPGEGEVAATTQTTSTFRIAASELQQPGIFQCVAWASNAGGAAGATSNGLRTNTPAPSMPIAEAPAQGVGTFPAIEAGSPTNGPVTLSLDLPAGEETRAAEAPTAVGWSCATTEPAGPVHAGVICERSDSLPPQQAYPEIRVPTALGADATDPAIAFATASGGESADAFDEDILDWADPVPFDLKSLVTSVLDENDGEYSQAGGHPLSAGVDLSLNTRVGRDGDRRQVEFLKDIRTDTPPGFLGNPQAAPEKCDLMESVLNDSFELPTCPRASIVGSTDLDTSATGNLRGLPLYLLEPERGVPAQLVFSLNDLGITYSLIPRLRPEDAYAISVDAPAASKGVTIFGAAVTLCGYGVDVAKADQAQFGGAPKVTSCKKPGDAGANPVPFITNPTECTGVQPVTTVSVASWEDPTDFKSRDALSPLGTGCENVPFDPEMDLVPTSKRADSPTGLDVRIEMPTDGLETPGEIAQSALKKAVVTLPQGMAVNPSAADGLGACASNQIKLGTNDPVSCPDSSKVGTAKVQTPLLEETLEGGVYLAKQGDNPFGSLLALYLVVESKERGILVKIPGEVEADPSTGQLVSTFDENPQMPFSSLELSFDSGNRAPLLAPPKCGTYDIVSQLYPYSDPDDPVTQTSTFRVSQGPDGRGCPNGSLDPKLNTGVQNPLAGSTSPFLVGLSRDDGSQRIRGLEMTLPPGLTAYLRGVASCPDSSLASVSGALGSGRSEIASPSCPSASQIGTVSVGAGGGPTPFYVDTGRAYLSGPYKGAPLSIAVIAPAVAGPFDLGSVVVRNAAYVNPVTTEIRIVSDPIPTILHGIPVDVRDVRVDVDRPEFTLAPTSCDEMAVGARVSGEQGASRDLSSRFQVGACDRLGFKPRLSLRLKGGTRRGENPKLIATVRAREGDANISALSVRLPRSAFLDQAHIRTICTRVQWAADACPRGSVYGKIRVTTPLLDYALAGSVYLRSSNNKLPDLVSDLRGPASQPIRVEFAGRTDSVKGALRNTFDFVPDAPFTTARLELFGGKRGLVVNSRNICAKAFRAAVQMDGQNGAIHDTRPVVGNDCAKGRKAKAKRKRQGHGR